MNLREGIKKILLETENMDDFLKQIITKFPETENFIELIKSFIEKSGCKKIEVASFKHGASGLALHDGVLFNRNIFYQNLPSFLFVIFHELAHQYQYKKYGSDKMYEVYLGQISVKEAAKFMKNIEIIADELATRKIRELQQLGFISKDFQAGGFYNRIPLSYFESMISEMKKTLSKEKEKNPETISRIFYNMVKINEPSTDNIRTEQKEVEITERCWKGYTQKGMKTMFGKRYPNCVKKNK